MYDVTSALAMHACMYARMHLRHPTCLRRASTPRAARVAPVCVCVYGMHACMYAYACMCAYVGGTSHVWRRCEVDRCEEKAPPRSREGAPSGCAAPPPRDLPLTRSHLRHPRSHLHRPRAHLRRPRLYLPLRSTPRAGVPAARGGRCNLVASEMRIALITALSQH